MTEIAVVDELAAAAELVKGKFDRVPVAVVRGLPGVGGADGRRRRGAGPPGQEDMFSLGTAEAIAAGRARRSGAPVGPHVRRPARRPRARCPVRWRPP